MNITPGTRLGPYEVIAPIGAGGMGEVYRARDTRLDRSVAIKVLPTEYAKNAQLRARFEREAKTISALNHPHICTLFDVGSQPLSDDGQSLEYLVMELLDGESLADRLARGPLPVDQALRYAVQICDALERAHRSGVVHRDLKPGNIMITKSGAKLLDFGLATAAVIGSETHPPDATTYLLEKEKPLTEEGTILGTFQYMSPEQLEGKPADSRSDIFALGAVLYEMVTGKRAFAGKSRASVIAAILAAEPQPVSALVPKAPAELDRILRLCLLKDADERWQSAHDLRLELERVGAEAPRRAIRSSSRLPWLVAALALLVAVGVLAWPRKRVGAPGGAVRFNIFPPSQSFFNGNDVPLVVSPDGSQIVYGVINAAQQTTLWVRRLDQYSGRPLPESSGAYDPFFSPDGQKLAFFVDRRLKRLDLKSGAVDVIADAGESRGASWSKSGDILIAPPSGTIARLDNGALRPVTKLDAARSEAAHLRPQFTSDGDHFIYFARSTKPELSAIKVGSIRTGQSKIVMTADAAAVYAPTGHLLLQRDGVLFAYRLDEKSFAIEGDPLPVGRNVHYAREYDALCASSSANGVLAWIETEPRRDQHYRRLDSKGVVAPLSGIAGSNVDLAPDETRVAYQKTAGQSRNWDIWITDLRRGVSSRVTFESAVNLGPVWSPDSKQIAYTVNDGSGASIITRPAAGGTSRVVLKSADGLEVVDWTANANLLAVEWNTATNRTDLIGVNADSGKTEPLVSSPFGEDSLRFSPDGKWFTYQSDESGRFEIYLQPLPVTGAKWQISASGGRSARWSRDGKQIYFVDATETLNVVDVTLGADVVPSAARRLFKMGSIDYEPLADGTFIAAEPVTRATLPIYVNTRWLSE